MKITQMEAHWEYKVWGPETHSITVGLSAQAMIEDGEAADEMQKQLFEFVRGAVRVQIKTLKQTRQMEEHT